MDIVKKDINNKNIIWIDNLRAVCAIGIVLLHVAAKMSRNYDKVSENDWLISNFYINLARFGVPIFIMMTGLLSLGKQYTFKHFTKKFSRVLVPFLFWSFIYIIFKILILHFKNHIILNFNFVIEYSYLELVTGVAYHMWYIYMLLRIYLLLPLINQWIMVSNQKQQLCFMIVCFLVLFIFCKFFDTIYLSNYIMRYAEFLGYLVLGYYLVRRKYKYNIKYYIISCIIIFLLSYLYICFDSYTATINSGVYTEQFKPWDLFQALSVFLLFYLVPIFNKKNKILSLISEYSYGIYLIHVLIIGLFDNIGLDALSFNPLFSIPIITFCTLIISILLLYILNKLPLGKYIVK